MTPQEVADNPVVSLAYLPPTSQQRRLIFIIAVLQFLALVIVAPFSDDLLPSFPALIPSFAGVISVNDLITAILLLAQYSLFPSRAILALAAGYLFTALIVIPQALTFPGAFTSTGLFGADLQSAGHLYMFWHIGAPMGILIYALLKHSNGAPKVFDGSPHAAVIWSVAIVFALVCMLTWYSVSDLPKIPFFVDKLHIVKVTWADAINIGLAIFDTLVLVVLWARRRSVLDYLLLLVVCSMITEQLLLVVFSSARFTLGFYAGRVFSLATSIFVLVALLTQTTRLYTRVIRSNILLERERNDRLMNVGATAAAIAHELKQPLAAMVVNADASLQFLDQTPPDVARAKEALGDIVADGHRTSETLDGVRALFRNVNEGREPVDVNEICHDVLHAMRSELNGHRIALQSQLTPGIPLVAGNRGQLQQVIFNLAHNAVEAMVTSKERSHVLRLITQRDDRGRIVVAVQDTGPGVDPKRLDEIFDAFVTTKPQGTGLGLAICRIIIERHGGDLTAFSDGKSGALFQFALPVPTS